MVADRAPTLARIISPLPGAQPPSVGNWPQVRCGLEVGRTVRSRFYH